jgi:hypothetical protein
MAGGKKVSRGVSMKKAGPTGLSLIPPLSIPWADESPYGLSFSKAFWWERILSGLEARKAVKEIVSERQFLVGHELGLGTFGLGYGLNSQPNFDSWPALDALIGSSAADRQLKEIMALYVRYDNLVREDFNRLKKEIRADLTADAVSQLKDKKLKIVSQLESLKHALRMADQEQRPAYEQQLGLLYFQWLRPYYYVAGIRNPATELNQMQTGVHFLGKYLGAAHPELVKILSKAEELLDGLHLKQVAAASVERAWAFQPRPLNNLRRLSNHALGRAVDIDPGTNPHIQGTDAKLVDEVLIFLKVPWRFSEPFLTKNLSQLPEAEAATLQMKMTAISNAIQGFLKKHLTTWEALTQQKADLDKKLRHWNESPKSRPSDDEIATVTAQRDGVNRDLQAPTYFYVEKLVKGLGGIKKARVAKEKGLITISVLVFMAFKRAGAILNLSERSGDEYKTAKDTMHFEVLPDPPLANGMLERERVTFARWFVDNL